ncbi:hypothetical protein [Micromonospora sp. WMMD980]|uniref:hypothetical protein n=1 Tax=Micromonospora sp. WMMD980 TaxID=3016088 RepID=UPI002417D884|nr:hypothetical protein [Micromonospora sp. WMMD980]MDG4801825.1 hypothetical protein [Micromonospora sp. WMMD980]
MGERVLIVSQDHEGHRLMYVRLLAGAALDRGDEVVLALTPAGFSSEEFRLHLDGIADRCRQMTLGGPPLAVTDLHRRAVRHGCTQVLVPDGDRFAVRLGLRGWPAGPPVVALVTQDPRWNTDRRLPLRARLWLKDLLLLRAGRLRRVRLLYLSDHSEAGRRARPAVAPDPVFFDVAELEPRALRREFGLPEDRFVFLVAGKVSARKNLPLVLRCVLRLADQPVALFVCGQVDPVVRAEVEPLLSRARAAGLPVVLHDRVQTDHGLNRAVQASDCVVVAYSSDQINSMMAKGVRAGRRVVVAGSDRLIGWARNLGVNLCGPLTEESLTGLLEKATGAPSPLPRTDLDSGAFVEAFRP